MPNKKYLAGRRFEYKIKEELQKSGWYVIRSAGSKSLFDLIGIRARKINGEIGSFEYQIHIGFWQLKKNISDNQALKILSDILNTLFNTTLVGHLQVYSCKNFTELSKICYIGNERREKDSQQYIAISFGIIYTPPKKLTKRQSRI